MEAAVITSCVPQERRNLQAAFEHYGAFSSTFAKNLPQKQS